LKILFLNSWYPNRSNDTLGNFVEKHIEAIAQNVDAYTCSIFSSDTVKEITTIESQKGKVKELHIYYPKPKQILFFKIFYSLYYLLKSYRLVYRYYKSKRVTFNLIHVNVAFPIGLLAIWLKSKLKVPYVVTEHSTSYSKKGSNLPFYQKVVAQLVFKNASHILPVSSDLKNAIERLGVTTPQTVVPNVVDVHLFELKENLQSSSIKFIHISTLNEQQKNISGILKVFSKLMLANKLIELTIVSDGSIEKAKELADALQIPASQLHFIGKSTATEIAGYLKQNDALVLFSNYENFPCVIPESFAVGTPVISSNVNGIPEYVNNLNGILVEPLNEEQLKVAILSIVNNKSQFDALTLRNYAISKFSYEAVGEHVFEIYKACLNVS